MYAVQCTVAVRLCTVYTFDIDPGIVSAMRNCWCITVYIGVYRAGFCAQFDGLIQCKSPAKIMQNGCHSWGQGFDGFRVERLIER